MPRSDFPDSHYRGRQAHSVLGPEQLAAVTGLFGVLSEASRLQILQQLGDGPAGVGELVRKLEMKQANVSKQLGILLTAGIIARKRDGNRIIYFIDMPLVFDLCNLVCRGMAKHAAKRAATLAKGTKSRH
ncbi:MAG TPA: metalloregulator ArsR/SmtB family transcription factor [Phycisphaerae bacterium]|nr:metalloregulator ArsR/SmtB family transcription factor [Phycisphaerae bacterium]